MLLITKLRSLKVIIRDYLKYSGYSKKYSNKDIECLWRQSGLTVKEVSEMRVCSIERAWQYCHGKYMSNRLKIELAELFIIYGKDNQ